MLLILRGPKFTRLLKQQLAHSINTLERDSYVTVAVTVYVTAYATVYVYASGWN